MFGYWEGINDARITREAYISGIKGWITEGYRQQEKKELTTFAVLRKILRNTVMISRICWDFP